MEIKLSCIAIDDEPLALDLIEDEISRIPFLKLVGKFSSALDAFQVLNDDSIDLMFLDIQMPDITGLEFLKSLNKRPIVIITTAYDNYALEGFNLDVIDYLVKPIPFDRFLKAAIKAREFFASRTDKVIEVAKPAAVQDFLFVKSGYDVVKINLNEIQCIEGLKDYVIIHLEGKKVISLYNLKTFLTKLPEKSYVRVHRSFIVAIDKIDYIKKNRIFIGQKEIPIGEHYKEDLEKIIKEYNL